MIATKQQYSSCYKSNAILWIQFFLAADTYILQLYRLDFFFNISLSSSLYSTYLCSHFWAWSHRFHSTNFIEKRNCQTKLHRMNIQNHFKWKIGRLYRMPFFIVEFRLPELVVYHWIFPTKHEIGISGIFLLFSGTKNYYMFPMVRDQGFLHI